MGNRAVIQFGADADKSPGIYLHWNGGRASVEAFLQAAQQLGVRTDPDYACARLTQIIANWFGGTLSVGAGPVNILDRNNGDNGVYIVENWKIVGREFHSGGEEVDDTKTQQILKEVLEVNQPIFAQSA